jgi:hypothetical protein
MRDDVVRDIADGTREFRGVLKELPIALSSPTAHGSTWHSSHDASNNAASRWERTSDHLDRVAELFGKRIAWSGLPGCRRRIGQRVGAHRLRVR